MSKLLPGDDFAIYVAQKEAGASFSEVADKMSAQGLGGIAQIRALRYVFELSLIDVKTQLVGGAAQHEQLQDSVAAFVPRALK